jgi:hypothetical protein
VDHGFTWVKHQSEYIADRTPFVNVDQDHGMVKGYLHETIELVKKTAGAQDVYVYDWRFRRNGTVYKANDPDTNPRTSRYFIYAPIGNVHTDYSFAGGISRLRLHLSNDELARIKADTSKVLLINAWRPLQVVENAPLAVCDRRSVKESDAILVDKVLPNNVEEETCILPKDYHKWYYMSKQTPEEVVLFIQWEDDGTESETLSVSHAALSGPAANIGIVPRESVEVRMIAVL